MEHVRIENGEIISVGLPEVGELPDGRQVSGFNKLDDETLEDAGWHKVEDPGPPDVAADQAVSREVVVENGQPVAVYTIEDIPPEPDPTASTETQLESLLSLLLSKGVITQGDVNNIKAG